MSDPRLEDLRAAHAAGALLIVAGPGVATAAGLPGLAGLARRAVAHLRAASSPGSAAAIDEVEDLLDRDDPLGALGAAEGALGAPALVALVQKALDLGDRPAPALATAIASLGAGLRGVLSLGLDGALEAAFPRTWTVLTAAPTDLASARRWLLKLHGTLAEPATWVLSRPHHERALFGSPSLEALFVALYRTATILFVGFGPDDGLIELVRRASAQVGAQPPVHVAMVSWARQKPTRTKTLEQAGVQVIACADDAAVIAAVRSIAAPALEIAPPPVVTPAPSRPGAPVRIFALVAPEDEALFEALADHLSALAAQGRIDLFAPHRLSAGEDRQAAITERFARAEVALVLVSADLLASEEGFGRLRQALDRERAGTLAVVPVRLRACDWEGTGLDAQRALPPGGPTVAGPDPDPRLLAVVVGLRAVIARLRP